MKDIIYIPQPQNDVAYKKTQYKMKPIGITIHNSATVSSARDLINYMHVSDDYRSFHFAVDDEEIVQGELTNMNTWHAGDGETGIGNRQTISIEISLSYCGTHNTETPEEYERWKRDYKKRFEKSQENGALLTAYLLMQYGWGFDTSRIYKHQDWSNKYCPHRTMSEYGWGYFLTLVEKAYTKLEGELPMTNAERAEFDALKKQVADLQKKEQKDHEQNYNLINTLKSSTVFISDQLLTPFYKTLEDIPDDDWCKPTIQKLVQRGVIKCDEKGFLNITNVLARILTILDRANIFN